MRAKTFTVPIGCGRSRLRYAREQAVISAGQIKPAVGTNREPPGTAYESGFRHWFEAFSVVVGNVHALIYRRSEEDTLVFIGIQQPLVRQALWDSAAQWIE